MYFKIKYKYKSYYAKHYSIIISFIIDIYLFKNIFVNTATFIRPILFTISHLATPVTKDKLLKSNGLLNFNFHNSLICINKYKNKN